MTREEIARTLSTIEQALDRRVHVWRIIIDPSGKEVGRIYRGSFNAPSGSYIGEPSHRRTYEFETTHPISK
jgi:hypothetical protein